MPNRRDISADAIDRKVSPVVEFTKYLAEGLVATDSLGYTPTQAIGTIPVVHLTRLVDPGVDLKLTNIEVVLTQRSSNYSLATASVIYNWAARQNNQGTLGEWCALGTFAKDLPRADQPGSTFVDTLSSYLPVATMPEAPLEIRFQAQSLTVDQVVVSVRGESHIKLVGGVIPGI